MSLVWKPKTVCYELEIEKRKAARKDVKKDDYHPLKLITVKEGSVIKISNTTKKNPLKTNTSKVNSNVDFVDPLSAFTATSNPLSDPLSVPPPKSKEEKVTRNPLEKEVETTNNEAEDEKKSNDWTVYKMKILNKFTTDEKLSISMTSLAKGDSIKEGQNRNYATSVSDKMKTRLGQLDDFEEGGFHEMQNLTQQEFINRIQELKQMLKEAWDSSQKVKALKISIQCAKLLNDTSVMQFYPSKFVLIADVLDSFGSLVFQRILTKCEPMKPGQVDPKKVTTSAREICINWLLKIASIRELLPRLCIEAATIRCNEFIRPGDWNCVLLRLTNMARGIGNPLVAVFIRAYLCRVGMLHMPSFRGHLKYNFYDYLSSFQQIRRDSVHNMMAAQKISLDTYLSYHKPAVDWILSCLAKDAHEETLTEVIEKCKRCENSLLLINCCLTSFRSEYVATRALSICRQICSYEETVLHKLMALEALGKSTVNGEPPEADRLPLLNEVWKLLVKVKNPEHFLSCASPWMEYAAKYFSKREVNTVLGEVIKHMTPDRAFERLYPELHSVMGKVLDRMPSVAQVFYMDKFLPYIDMFQHEERKAEICLQVGQFFVKKQEEETCDPIIVNVILYICKAIHDALNALSIEDRRKQSARLICSSIDKISFRKDFEQQLAFYVTCRANFCNLDAVIATLVHSVNRLSTKVTSIIQGNHTKKTSAFVRACTAFSFITIPSLSNNLVKFNLYIESGQVALNCQCVSQADAMFKSAIGMLHEMKSFSDVRQSNFWPSFITSVSNLLSSLLLVPDNTEKGVLYLLRGLLNAISESNETVPAFTRCNLFIKVLALLTAYSQDQYLHRIDKIESNETLYSNDPKFLDQIAQISMTVLNEIFSYIGGNDKSHGKGTCILLLLDTIISHGKLDDETMCKMLSSVWKLAIRSGCCDQKHLIRIRNHIVCKKIMKEDQLPLHSRV